MNAHLMTRNLRVSRCNKAFLRRAIRDYDALLSPPFRIFHAAAWKRRMQPVVASANYLFRYNLSGLVLVEVQS